MNTWKVIFATIVIFGAGVVTGGLLVKHVASAPRYPHPNLPIAANRPYTLTPAGGIKVEFLRRAERELSLTKEQRESIDKIISASQEHTRKLMEPITPQIREELQTAKDQFVAVLTPEQRVRFEEMLRQQRQLQQHPREPRRPPGRSPETSSLPSPVAEPVSKQ